MSPISSRIHRLEKFPARGFTLAKALFITAVLVLLALVAILLRSRHAAPAGAGGPVARADAPAIQIIGKSGRRTPARYELLPSATRPWRIVALFPHMKDSYWHAVDFGMIEHARRLGISLRILHAGGYENLAAQRDQFKSCIRNGDADAVVLCAISLDGLDDLVAEAVAKGISVVDSVNGASAPGVGATSLSPNRTISLEAGKFLAKKHPAGSPPVKLAWFPGPTGAGWVIDGDTAFRQGLTGSSVEIVGTFHGDTGVKVQGELILEELVKHPDIAYIVGTAVTAKVAPALLRDKDLDSRVGVVATYINPGVFRHLKRGTVAASTTGGPADLGRIGVNRAVRLLEKKPVIGRLEPSVRLLEPAMMETYDRSHDLAPGNFEPVFTVNASR